MICYLSADLVKSTTSDWTVDSFENAIKQLKADLDGLGRLELVVSQGDSFQIECPASNGWMVALMSYFRMKAVSKQGARVAFSLGKGDTTKGRSLGARNGLVYQQAGRGVKALHDQDLKFGFFPTSESAMNVGWKVASEYAETLLRSTTKRQAELLCAALRPNIILVQDQIALEFGLANSTVSQHLAAGNFSLHAKSAKEFNDAFSTRKR